MSGDSICGSFPKTGTPLKWGTPKKVFVNSMSDLFHEGVPMEYIRQVCQVMKAADWHIFQVLTKRPSGCVTCSMGRCPNSSPRQRLVGSECRGPALRPASYRPPAASRGAKVRWLSIEPLLEDLGKFSLKGISWVVVGVSPAGALTLEADWVRHIQDQCDDQGVPFFFKQWGGVFKAKNGRQLDGQTYDDYPQIENKEPPNRRIRLKLIDDLGIK